MKIVLQLKCYSALNILYHPAERLAVVVGAGAVGRRKIATCLDAGWTVRAVDPVALPVPGVEWVAEPFSREHLRGATLVVAAATPSVNVDVVNECKANGLMVCSASDPDAGDFTFPSVLRRGRLTVAVSTSGASPALAARLRDELAGQFGPEYADWLELLAEARARVLDHVPDPAARRALLADFAAGRWLDRLREAGPGVVRAELLARIAAAIPAV